MTSTWRICALQTVENYDIPGADIPSKGQAFTEVRPRCLLDRRAAWRPARNPAVSSPHPAGPTLQICVPAGGYGPNKMFGFEAFNEMCDATPGCVAWTANMANSAKARCAVMKKAGKQEAAKPRRDWITGTSAVKAITCRFEGNKCSMDKWAQPFYCCSGEHP